MRLLILGCPRSGTMYVSRFLQHLGFDFGHECVQANGGVGWMFASGLDMDLNSKHFPAVSCSDFDYVIHQVRHPLDVVRSLPVSTHPMWSYAENLLGPLPKSRLEKHLWFWAEWNRLCQSKSILTYQVESLPTVVRGVSHPPDCNTRVGTMKYLSRPSWVDASDLCPLVVDMAVEYGYLEDS